MRDPRQTGDGDRTPDTTAEKARLRKAALLARAAGGDARALTARLTDVLVMCRGLTLASYWPMRGEPDPRPAVSTHLGHVCLPVVLAPDRALIFRRYDGRLEPGAFGTQHPPEHCVQMAPEVVIVPLAGFDRHGNRLGYGGGFYDRTLEMLRQRGPILAIGLAFAGQELPAIPTELTDQRLDLIVTDCETIRLRG